MLKHAGLGSAFTAISDVATKALPIIGSGYLIYQAIDKVKRDARCQRIIRELHDTDPEIRKIDPQTLLQWYGTIYNYSPKLAADKETVREVLRNFARFGKIDLQVLKSLAETESKMDSSASEGPLGGRNIIKWLK